jgi:hypothetical protein
MTRRSLFAGLFTRGLVHQSAAAQTLDGKAASSNHFFALSREK